MVDPDIKKDSPCPLADWVDWTDCIDTCEVTRSVVRQLLLRPVDAVATIAMARAADAEILPKEKTASDHENLRIEPYFLKHLGCLHMSYMFFWIHVKDVQNTFHKASTV